MKCSACKHENRKSANFCSACGTKLILICPGCNNQMPPQAQFCDKCGIPFSGKKVPSKTFYKREEQAPAGKEPEAERRQLTVMFCDLVGSTSLSEQIDPEELRDLIKDYQSVCNKVIQGYEGQVHQFMGDGVLAIFGYPKAHEDEAHRAVRSGLAILDGIQNLNIRLKKENKPALSVRIGIHTGLVVIGEMSGELQVMGETTNLAARLQGIAKINTLVISEISFRLIKGYFECRSLGGQKVKGISRTIQVFQVLHESGARSRLEIFSSVELTTLVGREQELALMIHHWEESLEGRGHIILIEGEAGIGKSRLVYAIKKHIAKDPEAWLTECLCSPYHQNSAFFPIINLLEKVVLQFSEADSQKEKLEKLEGFLTQFGYAPVDYVPLLASLLSIPFEESYPPSNLSPEQRKKKIFRLLLSILLSRSEKQPVLFVVEDLHWIDPTTLEFLSLITNQVPAARILILFTFRPQFIAPWSGSTYMTRLALKRLGSRHTKRMIDDITREKSLPEKIVDHLTSKTDGVPLFIEELTKMILESGYLEEGDDSFQLKGPLPALAIPATLKDSLMTRLDRLATVKDVAQLGAVIGREFSYSLLKHVSGLKEESIKKALHKLVGAEILYQRGIPPQAIYFFKHAMIQDTAYESLLKTKRQQYHQQVALTIEEHFSNIASSQPEVLAYHYTEAGLTEESIEYWYRAGKLAAEQFANKEAIAHLKRGVKSINFIEDSQKRDKRELDFLILLGPAIMNVKGYSSKETAQVYERAETLCQQLGESPSVFHVLSGQFWFHLLNSKFKECQRILDRMMNVIEKPQSSDQEVQTNSAAGTLYLFLGNPVLALGFFSQLIKHYDKKIHGSLASRYGHDLGVIGICMSARALWMVGYPDKALERIQQALNLANDLSNPYMIVFTNMFAAGFYKLRSEAEAVLEHSEKSIALAEKHAFDWIFLICSFWHGWALTELREGGKGVSEIKKAIDLYLAQASGIAQGMPHILATLAESYIKEGLLFESLREVEEALQFIAKTGERWYEAEIYRLKGEILFLQGKPEAKSILQEAVEIARRQEAKSWELRAATSLARLLAEQGKKEEALEVLEPVYHWFSEGFDTANLKDAKELLGVVSK